MIRRSTTWRSLRLGLCLLPHLQLQLQQVWFRAAGGAGPLPVAVIEGLTAVVELVDDALALVLLVRVPLEAVWRASLAVASMDWLGGGICPHLGSHTRIDVSHVIIQRSRRGRLGNTDCSWVAWRLCLQIFFQSLWITPRLDHMAADQDGVFTVLSHHDHALNL